MSRTRGTCTRGTPLSWDDRWFPLVREEVFDVQPLPKVGHNVEFTAVFEESTVAEFADLVGYSNATAGEVSAAIPRAEWLVQGALLVEFVNSALRSLMGEGYVLREHELRSPSAVSIGEQVTVQAEVVRVHEDERTVSVDTQILRADGETVFRGLGRLIKLEPSG